MNSWGDLICPTCKQVTLHVYYFGTDCRGNDSSCGSEPCKKCGYRLTKSQEKKAVTVLVRGWNMKEMPAQQPELAQEECKNMFAAITESLKPVPRVCRMCGRDYVGYKTICNSEFCWVAWQHEIERIRRKYVCGLPPMGLVFYMADKDEEKIK